MRSFNTTGVCIPEKHYMVDISERIQEIAGLVDDGKYFSINRARQYGKSTTIAALSQFLSQKYTVISLDFQSISAAGYKTEQGFVQEFARLLINKAKENVAIPETVFATLEDYVARNDNKAKLGELFDVIKQWCAVSEKELVLIIDEVDSVSNNQVFVDFLAQLREGYIQRDAAGIPAFKSVIMAGVTDVKHLRSKIRDDEQHKVNSPWNIAADFNVNMSLTKDGIRKMLDEYAHDHGFSMDANEISQELVDYTNGYPFLVSRLCQIIDERLLNNIFDSYKEAWTRNGMDEAVKSILIERNTLFESLVGKLINYPNIKSLVKSILMEGLSIPYNGYQEEISQMQMYGFVRNNNGYVAISNRIYETFLYNYYLSEEIISSNEFYKKSALGKNKFVVDGKLNLRLILESFIRDYTEICGPLVEPFKEKDGREQFLLYLKPIINGTGNYYIEAQTRNQRRTDVIIDYLGQRYIIEMKIWHGDRYNADGEKQICDYLDYFNLQTGYMLSFNFNQKKKVGVERKNINDKVVYEAML